MAKAGTIKSDINRLKKTVEKLSYAVDLLHKESNAENSLLVKRVKKEINSQVAELSGRLAKESANMQRQIQRLSKSVERLQREVG